MKNAKRPARKSPMTAAPVKSARPLGRRASAARRERVFSMLRGGAGVLDVARCEKLTPRSIRRIVEQSLALRELSSPQGYAQLQIARLNDVLLVTYDKMGQGDLKAVDRVLKTLAEMDRYHNFRPMVEAAPMALEAPRAPASRPRPARALPAPDKFSPADSNRRLNPCNVSISGLNGERVVDECVSRDR